MGGDLGVVIYLTVSDTAQKKRRGVQPLIPFSGYAMNVLLNFKNNKKNGFFFIN